MSKSYGVTTETFLVLAWASRQPGLRERLTRLNEEGRRSELALRAGLTGSVPFVFEDAAYGPAYERLFLYRLGQVDWELACWALRAYAGVHLKESGGSDAAGVNAQTCAAASEETALLWEAITRNDRLASRLRLLSRDWGGSVSRGAQLLRLHFLMHLPLVRTAECPFLVHELLVMSLERVNWHELAAQLLGVPTPTQAPPESEGEPAEDEVLCIATLLELIRAAQVSVGEYVLEPKLTGEMRGRCAELAETCGETHLELRQLWEEARALPHPR